MSHNKVVLSVTKRSLRAVTRVLQVACVAGVQRGGMGEVKLASRSNLTSPLPPLCTPATQAVLQVVVILLHRVELFLLNFNSILIQHLTSLELFELLAKDSIITLNIDAMLKFVLRQCFIAIIPKLTHPCLQLRTTIQNKQPTHL